MGESNLFWRQLGDAGLISGKFNQLSIYSGADTTATIGKIGNYLPQAKIGGGSSFVYVGGTGPGCCSDNRYNNGKSYFNIGTKTQFTYGANGDSYGAALTPAQAYAIDSKIDNGLPQSGKITAMGANSQLTWVWFGAFNGGINALPTTNATSGSSTTCYDNNNTNGAVQQYSIGQNGGNNITCPLAVEF